MRVLLDTGALIALEKRSPGLLGLIDELAEKAADVPLVPATVLAQTWRGGRGRQAPVSRWLSACDINVLDETSARAVGELLASSGSPDIVDAHLVVCAKSGDVIVTTDPRDIATLARAADKAVGIVAL